MAPPAYRALPDAEPPRELRFDQLTARQRRSLLDACLPSQGGAGHGARPLLQQRPSLPGHFLLFVGLALLAAFLFIACLFSDFGHLHPHVTMTSGLRPLVALSLFVLASLAAALAWRASRLQPAAAPPPGCYLFARDLIVAWTSPRLLLIPTTYLEAAHERRRHVELRLRDGSHLSLDRPPGPPNDWVDELHTLREAAELARQSHDLSTLRKLDPLADDPLPQGRPLSGFSLRRPWSLGLLPWLLLPALSFPLGLLLTDAILTWSERTGVERAVASGDLALLAEYVSGRHDDPRSFQLADRFLFEHARAAPDSEELLQYLRRPGDHGREASDELYGRIGRGQNDALALEFLRFGQGPRRDAVDAALFARLADDGWLMERYAEVGQRRDEVRRVWLPRHRIQVATSHDDPAPLRLVLGASDLDPAVQQQARDALQALYARGHQRLLSGTGLRTPLAQALDEALTRATPRGGALVVTLQPDPQSAPEALQPHLRQLRAALYAILQMYLDERLLPVRDASSDVAAELRVSLLTAPPLPPPEASTDVTVTLTLALGDERRALPTLRWRAPSPTQPAGGRTFQMVAQQTLSDALTNAGR